MARISALGKKYIWNYGSYELPPFKMTAGQSVAIELEWNFADQAHAKDWSVTMYGDGKEGTLHLAHNKGLTSDSWKPILRKDAKPASSKVNKVPTPKTPEPKPAETKAAPKPEPKEEKKKVIVPQEKP